MEAAIAEGDHRVKKIGGNIDIAGGRFCPPPAAAQQDHPREVALGSSSFEVAARQATSNVKWASYKSAPLQAPMKEGE